MTGHLDSKQLVLFLVITAVATLAQTGGTVLNVTIFEINPGGVAKLPCDLPRGMSRKRIWLKDGKMIDVSKTRKKRLRLSIKGVLMIRRFERRDEGMYVCEFNGKVIKRIGLRYKEILGRPLFRDGLGHEVTRTKVALVNNNVKIECRAEGTQPISYRWEKNGRPLLQHKYKVMESLLKINNLILTDAGTYTCIASNINGSSVCSHELLVNEVVRAKPFLQPDFPRSATARVGENASMECYEMFGDKSGTIADFRWFLWLAKPNTTLKQDLNKLKVSNESSTRNFELISSLYYKPIKKNINNKDMAGVRMNLYNVSKQDQGYYCCAACNHLGCAVRSATLTVVEDTVQTPFVGDDQVQAPAAPQNIYTLLVVVCVAVFVVVAIVISIVYWRMSRKDRKRRQQCRNDSVTDANLNKKNFVVKYDGFSDSKTVSLSSSTAPLIHKSSLRGSFESQWSASFQRGSLQISTALNADACLETMEIPLDREWEIDRESLLLGETLGEGAFGVVVKAEALCLTEKPGCVSTVAVKMLKADATEHELHDLLSEMETMKRIGSHINIINFLGCCTQNGSVYAVVEFAPHGNLRQYLRSRRPPLNSTSDDSAESTIAMSNLVSFALQVAKGMEFLANRKCIHRDLAARNVLVGEDFIMKIADFGLARNVRESDYYRKTTDGRLPIKWLSIEALFDRVYTTQSDVWAYGVLLWEIFTLGGSPYPSIPVGKLFSLLKSGYRMQKPQGCPSDVYEVMLKCWYENAFARPSFLSLVNQFEKLLEDFVSVDYIEVVADSTDCIPEEIEPNESDAAEHSSELSADEETPFDMLDESTV